MKMEPVEPNQCDEKHLEAEFVEEKQSKSSFTHTGGTIDAALEQKVRLKCDYKLVPMLFLLLLCAFIDRINIGNARIQGLEKDLGMKGHDFNIALSVFFIPYILLEVPSNLLMRSIRPSLWLSGLIFGWGKCFHDTRVGISANQKSIGVVTVCQGIAKSFAGLVVCRVLIGTFEAGFFPGMKF